MKTTLSRNLTTALTIALKILVLSAAPVAAFAHPGHFDPGHLDHVPFAHATSHGLIYLLGFAAMTVFVTEQLVRLRRGIRSTIRSK